MEQLPLPPNLPRLWDLLYGKDGDGMWCAWHLYLILTVLGDLFSVSVVFN